MFGVVDVNGVVPPVAAAATIEEVQAASDDDRNALMTYLSQPETTLLANTEIHATLGDVDAIIAAAGGIQRAIESNILPRVSCPFGVTVTN
jgi:hypothetical protein